MSNSTERSRSIDRKQLSRRSFMAYTSGLGLTSTMMSGALWAKVVDEEHAKVTKEMLQEAERRVAATE